MAAAGEDSGHRRHPARSCQTFPVAQPAVLLEHVTSGNTVQAPRAGHPHAATKSIESDVPEK